MGKGSQQCARSLLLESLGFPSRLSLGQSGDWGLRMAFTKEASGLGTAGTPSHKSLRETQGVSWTRTLPPQGLWQHLRLTTVLVLEWSLETFKRRANIKTTSSFMSDPIRVTAPNNLGEMSFRISGLQKRIHEALLTGKSPMAQSAQGSGTNPPMF